MLDGKGPTIVSNMVVEMIMLHWISRCMRQDKIKNECIKENISLILYPFLEYKYISGLEETYISSYIPFTLSHSLCLHHSSLYNFSTYKIID